MSGGIHFDFSSPSPSPLQSQTQGLFHIETEDTNIDDDFEPMKIDAQSRLENAEVNFIIHFEKHTLGNILKEYLFKMKEVEFVGVRQHHKLDKNIHLRVKLRKSYINSSDKPVEQLMTDCLRKACRQAIDDCVHLRNTMPDISPRTVQHDTDGMTTVGVSDNIQLVSPFKTLFDPSELTF